MTATDPAEPTLPAPAETLQRWGQLLGESQKLMMAFMAREAGKPPANPYPGGLFEGWAEFAGALAKNPRYGAQCLVVDGFVSLACMVFPL